MFSLKSIPSEAVPRALEKAERYRLLHEPRLVESICLDILAIAPGNQQALVMLLLSIVDQFEVTSQCDARARALLPLLKDEYEKIFYSGLIAERHGKSLLQDPSPNARFMAYDYLRDAMEEYERAISLAPPWNNDAALRWNACARLIELNQLEPAPPEEDKSQAELE